MPLHPSKLRSRGYNQAELLAQEIGKSANLNVETNLLERTRNSPPQAQSADSNQRALNTAGAF